MEAPIVIGPEEAVDPPPLPHALSAVARASPTAAKTVGAEGRQEHLGPFDSVHLPKGTLRRIDNRSARPATLLVIIGQAQPPGGGLGPPASPAPGSTT
ncbi:MAG TPA: hypothetical protein VMV07_18975 [Streptosporangiaceae bacterium]|nr:hypothetical protein [Streptosporangiaceae bacterium]